MYINMHECLDWDILLDRGEGVVQYAELLNAALCLRNFIYKGPKMKSCSACRPDQAQSNGPTLRSVANFHIELEQFSCSLTATYACI